MNFEYDSDFSGQSSTTSYSTDDSANNVIEPDDNFDLLENDEDLDYDLVFTIPYEKTKTKRGRDAIKIEDQVFVFKKFNKNNTIYWRCQHNNCPSSVTTWNELGCLNAIEHSHDKLNDSERKCALVEEAIIKRAIEEDTPIPKIYADEINNIVSERLDHEQVAAFLNLKQNQILQRAYRARE
ncbi:unnamed protein product, partial [Brachionus calyciflorus]